MGINRSRLFFCNLFLHSERRKRYDQRKRWLRKVRVAQVKLLDSSAEIKRKEDKQLGRQTKVKPMRQPLDWLNLLRYPPTYQINKHPKMLSTFQTKFQRLEQALNTLVESVAAYNPSVTAADELVAADDELNKSLEQRMFPTFLVRRGVI